MRGRSSNSDIPQLQTGQLILSEGGKFRGLGGREDETLSVIGNWLKIELLGVSMTVSFPDIHSYF